MSYAPTEPINFYHFSLFSRISPYCLLRYTTNRNCMVKRSLILDKVLTRLSIFHTHPSTLVHGWSHTSSYMNGVDLPALGEKVEENENQ